jgi:hypothetical protein
MSKWKESLHASLDERYLVITGIVVLIIDLLSTCRTSAMPIAEHFLPYIEPARPGSCVGAINQP